MHRLQKRLFVKGGFCLDELAVNGLENRVVAKGERITRWVGDGVICVSPWAIDIRDGVANQAGYSRLRRFIAVGIKIRMVEGTAEEWNRVMTSGTQARCFNVAIALLNDIAGSLNAESISRVIKRAEAMHAETCLLGNIGMTFGAGIIVHQMFRWNGGVARAIFIGHLRKGR